MTAALIQAAPVERDESGFWWHPDMPDFEEGQECEWHAWIAGQGLKIMRGRLEDEDMDHPVYVAYFDNADPDLSAWTDTPPEGDGWFTLAIYDSEDGPVWSWARREVQS